MMNVVIMEQDMRIDGREMVSSIVLKYLKSPRRRFFVTSSFYDTVTI